MGVIEDMKKKAVSFNAKTEQYIDNRLKESSYARAILLLFCAVLVWTIFGLLSAYVDTHNAPAISSVGEIFKQKMLFIIVPIILLSTVLWCMGKRIVKKESNQPSLDKFLYGFSLLTILPIISGIVLILLELLNYGLLQPFVNVILSLIALSFIFQIPFYLLVLIKRLFKIPSFINALGIYIVASVLTAIILFGALIAISILH